MPHSNMGLLLDLIGCPEHSDYDSPTWLVVSLTFDLAGLAGDGVGNIFSVPLICRPCRSRTSEGRVQRDLRSHLPEGLRGYVVVDVLEPAQQGELLQLEAAAATGNS